MTGALSASRVATDPPRQNSAPQPGRTRHSEFVLNPAIRGAAFLSPPPERRDRGPVARPSVPGFGEPGSGSTRRIRVASTEVVGDGGDEHDTRPGRDVRNLRHPHPARATRQELAPHEIRRPAARAVRSRLLNLGEERRRLPKDRGLETDLLGYRPNRRALRIGCAGSFRSDSDCAHTRTDGVRSRACDAPSFQVRVTCPGTADAAVTSNTQASTRGPKPAGAPPAFA